MAKKVLIVDDVDIIRKTSEMIARSLKYETVTAVNGEEALERIAEHNPDLILTDVNMPLMDGLELCRRLREDGKYRRIPIIVYSGEDNREEAFRSGADDYLQKPFRVEELESKLREYLRQ